MSNYTIYMHLNNINGKVYIGQTGRKNLHERYGKNGKGYYDCPKFGNAIKKYGWNNFSHLILEENVSINDIDYKERFYIKLFHSTDIEFGYNISNGGCFGKIIPEETRQKIRESLIGKPSKNKGRHHTEEAKRKMSESIRKSGRIYKGRVWTEGEKKRQSERLMGHCMPDSVIQKLKQYKGENATWYGRHHTEETKEKLRQYCGEKASFYGKKHTQECKDYMSRKVSGKNNQAYGKHWYTNGVNNYFGFECPNGYHKGRCKTIAKKPL